jgi:hypothetical protein
MALIHTLRDDFSTDTLATNWTGSAGTVAITGGRMRVTCDTAFNKAQTAASYTLDGSKVCVQVFAAAAGSATVEATTELLVTTTTAGTDAGITLNAVTGLLTFSSRSGFFDGGATTLAYNATTHRWWRLRVTSGTLLWETSPDGDTWTTQRSASAPAWVSDTDLAAALTSHRNNGTDDFAEFDNYNIATVAATAVAGTTTLTATATGSRRVNATATAGAGTIAPAVNGIHKTVHATATAGLRIRPAVVGDSSAIEYPAPAPTSRWQILTGPASGGYAQELTAATDRRFTARLKDPSELAFGIDGRHREALTLDEFITDAHVLWTSELGVVWNLFRGRIGASSDVIDEDSHRMSVTALDYRALLTRRRLYAGRGINPNDSFEDGLGFWTGAGGTLELDDGQHSDRLKSGRITPDGVTATTSITSANAPASEGTTYRLSGSMRCISPRSVTLGVDWKNSGGGTISSSSITLTLVAETRTRVDEDAVAPAGTTQFAIVFLTTGTAPVTDLLWLDDAKLTTYPTLASRLVYSDVEQVDIAWDMINDTQSRVGGALGISNASTATGVVRDRLYLVGDSIGEEIDKLSEVEAGFDWDIIPISASALQFKTWHEERGVSRGVVLEHDGPVVSVQRQVTATEYANAIRFTGADTTIPDEREADDLATAPEGRFDAVFADTGLTTQDALNGRAHWRLKQSKTVRPTWSVILRRGYWRGPDHIWLGDPVRLVVYSGHLTTDTILRVYEIAFSIDADGGEQIELTLNGPKIDYRRPPAIADRRLTNLERR